MFPIGARGLQGIIKRKAWDQNLNCLEETLTVLLMGRHDWEMTLGTHVWADLRRATPGTTLAPEEGTAPSLEAYKGSAALQLCWVLPGDGS